jgi:hypothetical protein
MTAVVRALLIGALLFGGELAGGRSPSSGQGETPANSVVLTNTRPQASFPLSAATLATAPRVLALHFTRVTNPAGTPFEIFVYLSYEPPQQGSASAPARIPLGDMSLYPPDRPGGFVVRASNAFRKLNATKATRVRLVLEMQRLHPGSPWSQIELTVAPPEWRYESLP